MNYTSGLLTGIAATLIAVGGIAAALSLGRPGNAGKKVDKKLPATVPHPLKEEQVNTVTLTPEAVARLALKTAPVEKKAMRRVRVYGGEVTVPAGRAVIVSAPLCGMLQAVPGHALRAGLSVEKGEKLLRLLPLLTPEGRANLAATQVEAEGQVNTARSQVDAALIALNRASRLLKGEAGSRRAVDEAQALHDLANKALQAATSRRDLLKTVLGEVEKGTAGPIAVDAPEAGIVRSVSALPGQTVPNGAALFEVVNLDEAWVRVPVYAGEVSSLETKSARVGSLSASAGELKAEAKAVAAPPSANAVAATVDLYFALDNRTAKYSPGQRVAVQLGVNGEDKSLTLPWSAVVFDIHGGTWVYEEKGERTFTRRRVVVRHVVGDTAVLASGPAVGALVVSAGAAELFGAESGFTK